MKKVKSKMPKVILLVLFILVISLVHTVFKNADNPLSMQVERVRMHVQSENWQEANLEADVLMDLFNRKRWMLELFGPFEHVSDASQDISVLIQVTELEEKNEAMKYLARIGARFEEFVIF